MLLESIESEYSESDVLELRALLFVTQGEYWQSQHKNLESNSFLTSALKDVRRAATIKPNDHAIATLQARILSNMAVNNNELGKYDDARLQLTESLKIIDSLLLVDPTSQRLIHDAGKAECNLGQTIHRMNGLVEAKRH